MTRSGQLRFNLVARSLTVEHSLPDEDEILRRLEAIGMDPRRDGAEVGGKSRRWGWAWLALSGNLAAGAEISAWQSGSDSSGWSIGLALLAMLVGGRDTFRSGWIALRARSFNMNFLMTLAIVGAVLIGKWPEAAMVCFLFSLAEAIEKLSMEKARNAIQGLLRDTPETALVRTCGSCCGGKWETRPLAAITEGQTVRVRPGERIPLDGTVVEGASWVNQAPITGESMPAQKGPGDPVYAGTLNEKGSFDFKVTGVQGQTTLDRIVLAVQKAQEDRAPSQRWIDRFAAVYTPVMLVLALLLAVVPPLLWGAPVLDWVYRALVLLVVACPCALVLSTPITVVSGLAAAARQGIFVKGGTHLENGVRLAAVAFDKTGTLTEGHPAVTDVLAVSPELSGAQALRLAASLENHSEHPLAAAVVRHWQAQAGELGLFAVQGFEALPGRGVRGTIEGIRYGLGSIRQVQELGLCSIWPAPASPAWSKKAKAPSCSGVHRVCWPSSEWPIRFAKQRPRPCGSSTSWACGRWC